MLALVFCLPAEAKAGPELGASIVADTLANVSGGISSGAETLWRADATATFDAPFGIEGATAFVDIMHSRGKDFSGKRVGDAQVVSNVQGDGKLRPFEAWIEVPLAGSGLAFKAGLVDLNTEFDVQPVGAFFLNSSHGIGPEFSQSGDAGPSIFPVTSSALILRWGDERKSLRLGAFNAVAGDPDSPANFRVRLPGNDGLLMVGEGDVTLRGVTVQLGAWAYTSRGQRLGRPEGVTARQGQGIYGQVHGRIAGRRNERTLDGWIRAGRAGGATNRIGTYVGGGFTYGNDDEKVGLAIASARQTSGAARIFAPMEGRQARAETVVELSYARQVTESITFQPDLQYVRRPSWSKEIRDALVVGVRLSLVVGG